MSLILAIVPKESASAILLFVGLVITAQAFEVTPPRHFPAVVFGLVPHVAAWGVGILDTLATAAGTSVSGDRPEAIRGPGSSYDGPAHPGRGVAPDVDDPLRVDHRHHRPAADPPPPGWARRRLCPGSA